jgi:hypothetical protein
VYLKFFPEFLVIFLYLVSVKIRVSDDSTVRWAYIPPFPRNWSLLPSSVQLNYFEIFVPWNLFGEVDIS